MLDTASVSSRRSNISHQRRRVTHNGGAPASPSSLFLQSPRPAAEDKHNDTDQSHNNNNNEQPRKETEAEAKERQSLINEIQRLEKSMVVALRTSHDEITALKEEGSQKQSELSRLEEELKKITSGNKTNNNNISNGKGSDHKKKDGPNRRPSIGGQSQGSFRRMASFRRPSMGRRRSGSSLISSSEEGNNSCSNNADSDYLNGSNHAIPALEASLADGGSNNNNNITNPQQLDQLQSILQSKSNQIIQLHNQEISNRSQLSYLQSKLISIRTQTKSYNDKATSHEMTFHNQKSSTMLLKQIERRERLIIDIEKCIEEYNERIGLLEDELYERQRGIVAVSGGGNSTTPACNTSTTATTADTDGHGEVSADATSSKIILQLQNEITKYQIKLCIHKQYTSKAIHSFISILDTAKNADNNDDVGGVLLLLGDDDDDDEDEVVTQQQQQEEQGGAGGGVTVYATPTIDVNEDTTADRGTTNYTRDDKVEKRQKLIEDIALNVDIQINNLDMMMKEMDDRIRTLTAEEDESGRLSWLSR